LEGNILDRNLLNPPPPLDFDLVTAVNGLSVSLKYFCTRNYYKIDDYEILDGPIETQVNDEEITLNLVPVEEGTVPVEDQQARQAYENGGDHFVEGVHAAVAAEKQDWSTSSAPEMRSYGVILEPGYRIGEFGRILGNCSSIRRYFQSWNQVPE
jgi:hypothetical protein